MKKIPIIVILLAVMTCVMVFSADLMVHWTYDGTSNDTAGFSIYYGTTSRVYTNFQRTGFVSSTVISNVPPNIPIFISGTGIGFDNLESDIGNEVVMTVMETSNSLPSMVKDFRMMKVTQNIY